MTSLSSRITSSVELQAILTLVLLVVLALVADWRRHHSGESSWLRHDASDHLGAEYNNIATAVRAGRGFADPFHAETGPTAWMPPTLVYITAGLYVMFDDDRGWVVESIVILSLLSNWLAALVVVVQAGRLGRVQLGYTIVVAYWFADYFELFQMTHDTWWIQCVLLGTWWGANKFWRKSPTIPLAMLWGTWGGIAALSSPIVGVTWGIVTLILWRGWVRGFGRQATENMSGSVDMMTGYRSLLVAAGISILVISPWMIRNRIVMSRWIPIKSNGAYEVWQSQVLDDDGVLDLHSAWQHPWSRDGALRAEYQEVGELAFIDSRVEPTIRSIKASPLDWLCRIGNRFVAACLWYAPVSPEEYTLAIPFWIRRLLFPLPWISLVVLLVPTTQKLSPEALISVSMYIVYLSPYVLVSYYERYGAPLFVIKCLLVLFAIDRVVTLRRKTRTASWVTGAAN